MGRRAKIVATLGPSSNTVEMIEKLIMAGLNIARLNMSHGTHEGHAKMIQTIRQASKNTGYEVGILCDLQGPKIRVDKLEKNLEIKAGETWYIGASDIMKKYPQYEGCFIPTVYKDLVKDAHEGALILFDDGLMEAKAIAKEGDVLEIEIVVGGVLKSNKGINLPNVNVSAPSFTEKDREDLMFGLKHDVDYVALSFVREASDIMEVKHLLHKLRKNVPIISKIEKPEAVTNIEEIIEATDCIMIARGDMGVEVGNHLVPSIQKRIIKLCNEKGVPVITATQMLESMTTNARPTRAEANDVANAVWDGTDAVMLSGETASGDYPVEALSMMGQIVEEAEKTPSERPLLRHMELNSISSCMQIAASIVAEKTNARWVVSVTQSGQSCLRMSRFRSSKRILGVTNKIDVIRRMCLYWGITPFYFDDSKDDSPLEAQMITILKEKNLVKNGDKIVITHGDGKYFSQSLSNSVRVEMIKDLKKQIDGTSEFQTVNIEKGRINLDTSVCGSCQQCVQVCPHGIWDFTKDDNKSTYIVEAKAKACSKDMECVEKCPTGAIEIIDSDL